MKKLCVWILTLSLLAGCDAAQRPTADALPSAQDSISNPAEISILAWNVESGGNDPAVIAEQLAEFDHDIFALSEVSPKAFEQYAAATGMDDVRGTSGRSDRLQILFSNRFKLTRTEEQDDINDGRHRSPLLVQLRDTVTGVDFQLNVNHLARGNAEFREEQANRLREWGRNQTLPTISIGDFNFDYSFVTQSGNDGFSAMLRDDVWMWVKPSEWIDTNWADRDSDGVDDYPDSMLDFAFVAGPAREWEPVCRVILREGDFPDTEATSDHRPVELVLRPN